MLQKKVFLYFEISIFLCLICCTITSYSQKADFENTELFTEGYPRAFFFRYSEGLTHVGYENWSKTFDRLGGIMGKCLDEEVPGRSSNIPFFTKFKKLHPEQLVMLHYNGNARDPRDNGTKFHAGHWLYYEGTKLEVDLKAEKGTITIKVEDPSIFKMKIGRYKSRNEDIGICKLTAEGKPDWNYAEQLQLVEVNKKEKTITVKRACYGTKPLVFKAGEALLSPHVTEGPWGKNNNLLWLYNHSTECPEDANGKKCDDILADEFGERFSKNGALEFFDGVEFDVLWNEISHPTYKRKVDADCDGIGDNGIINGVNTYSIGVYLFCEKLRKLIGAEKLIMADGMTSEFQRGVPFLNGIESEGWPHLRDPEVSDWSGGWNRHLFWNKNAFKPVFNYVNFKYIQNLKELPPINRQRLVWATSVLMDARITHSGYRINRPADGIYTEIIDEFTGGKRNKKYWLGKPLEPSVRMALEQKDMLDGEGMKMRQAFVDKIEGNNIQFSAEDGVLNLNKSDDGNLKFTVSGIKCEGPDLVVAMKIMCNPRAGYPKKMPRLLNVNLSNNTDYKLMSYVNDDWFQATFYFRDLTEKYIDLQFELESGETFYLKEFTVHAYPDVVYRRFENGIVIANPSLHNIEFDLKKVAKGADYYHINGSQDKNVNNGKKAKGKLIIAERAGLFLEKRIIN